MSQRTRSRSALTPARRVPLIAALVSLVAMIAAPAAAQMRSASLQPERPAQLIVPNSRIIVPPDAQFPIQLSVVSAEVTIVDQVATTTLRMTVSNPASRVQEAELIAPVPDGAAIRYFKLEGLGGDGGARLLPKDEARRIYEDIVRRMQDPAILEFAGYGFIRSNIFPVPPQGTQTIVLTYEQLLEAEGDRVDYLLPRTQSLADTGIEWRIDLTIRASRPIATIYSPSHDLAIEKNAREHRVSVAKPHEPGSVALSIVRQPAGEDFAATVIAYPDPALGENSGYFMLLAAPPAPDEALRLPREVTIVLDRSGSMRGEKLAQATESALQIIEALGPDEYFNIIAYSDTIDPFADKPVQRGEQSVQLARDYLKNIQAIGGTNIHDALAEALRPQPRPGTLPIVLFLTDGLATIGRTKEADIAKLIDTANPHQRRVFTFGVGFDVNAPLLTRLARDSRAVSTFVLPDQSVEVKVGEVFKKLAGPVLAWPEFTGSDPSHLGNGRFTQVLPAELPDLFAGDQLVVVGRYDNLRHGTLQIEGKVGDRVRTFSVPFHARDASMKNAFVPRLWATRRIGVLTEAVRRLGEQGTVASNDPRMTELVDEIVHLSTEFGILTEYTAFLADEDAGEMARRDIAAGATRALRERAVLDRSGMAAVNQEMNLNAQTAAARPMSPSEGYLDARMNRVQLGQAVQQNADRALVRRATRWIDSRLIGQETADPDETIAFASTRYFELADELAATGRQSLLANRGEVYLLHRGQRILVEPAS
ncbi:MAG: VIT domain-containing protein [Phycisphaerales bacterium JB037]